MRNAGDPSNTKATGCSPKPLTYVDELMVITLFKIVQNGGIVKIGQVGHIFSFLILRWVHLGHLFLLECFFLLVIKIVRLISIIRTLT